MIGSIVGLYYSHGTLLVTGRQPSCRLVSPRRTAATDGEAAAAVSPASAAIASPPHRRDRVLLSQQQQQLQKINREPVSEPATTTPTTPAGHSDTRFTPFPPGSLRNSGSDG